LPSSVEFVSNELAGKQFVFCVKADNGVADQWMSLFQLKPFSTSPVKPLKLDKEEVKEEKQPAKEKTPEKGSCFEFIIYFFGIYLFMQFRIGLICS
jgi:hypothetical protein